MTLEPVPEDWGRALAIVAHPDDLEYGAASAVARWTSQGKTVSYLLVTHGEAGIDTMSPDVCARVREGEERASAAAVGVSDVEFLDHPDGLIEYGLPLRRDLATAIRRHRPDIVLTINHHDAWDAGGRYLNMADHRHTGQAVLDAVRDAGNRWVFTDAGAPWGGVRAVLVSGSPHATHAVDVTGTLERGIASLREHRAYLEYIRSDPDKFLRDAAAGMGQQFGVQYAVSFELFPF